VTRSDEAFRQQAGEDWLVHTELLLDDRSGQADLPADAG